MTAYNDKSFARLLTLLCGTEARADGYLNLWAKRGDREKTSLWFSLKDAGAREQAEAQSQKLCKSGYDVYFGVCPSVRTRAGTERIRQSDVLCIPAYFMDVDTLEDGAKGAKAIPAGIADALTRLKSLEYPPSVCVRSGHGLHAYWLLETPISAQGHLEAAKKRLRAFADAVAARMDCPSLDTHASEPARVLRVPGTVNRKNGAELPVCVEYAKDTRYPAETLDKFAAQTSVRATPPAGKPGTDGGSLSDDALWTMLVRKNHKIQRLKNGDLSDYEGDHSAGDMAMCNALAFATGKDARRMDGLFRQTALYRDKWDEKHGSQTYGEMTIRKAIENTVAVYSGRMTQNTFSRSVPPPTVGETDEAFARIQQAYADASGGEYVAEPFRTLRTKIDRNGNVTTERLADFVIIPEESVTRDDGATKTRELVLSGRDVRGRILPRVRVPAAQLDAFRWVAENWPGAVVCAGQNKKDHLRAAIQQVERELAVSRTVYVHTGWTNVGGQWAYLYHGGAIGAESVSVEMPGKLSRYSLDAQEATCQAVSESMNLLALAPDRATVPLLLSMYLAPLCEFFDQCGERVSHMLIVRGKTQSKKSTLTALFLSHFGAGFSYNTLPLNFQSTGNALCSQLFALKDVPAVIDDFHPTPGEKRGAVSEMTQTARRISRAVGDDAGRARLQSGGEMQTEKPVRGLVIMTAEFEPDLGESGDSRGYVAPLNPGDVPTGAALDMAQENAQNGLYASAMRGYIEFIREKQRDADAFLKWLRDTFRQERNRLNRLAGEYGGHGRLATAGAHLLTAAYLMLEYAQARGAVDQETATCLFESFQDTIGSGLAAHARDVRNNDPVVVFSQALREISENEYAILSPNDETTRTDAFIGYRVEGALYLSPKRTFAAVSEILRKGGSALAVTEREMWRRLHEAGAADSDRAATRRIPGLTGTHHCLKLDGKKLDLFADGQTTKTNETWTQTKLAM